jgi:hypothetical protein
MDKFKAIAPDRWIFYIRWQLLSIGAFFLD